MQDLVFAGCVLPMRGSPLATAIHYSGAEEHAHVPRDGVHGYLTHQNMRPLGTTPQTYA